MNQVIKIALVSVVISVLNNNALCSPYTHDRHIGTEHTNHNHGGVNQEPSNSGQHHGSAVGGNTYSGYQPPHQGANAAPQAGHHGNQQGHNYGGHDQQHGQYGQHHGTHQGGYKTHGY